MIPRFDHEKLDAYKVGLQFVAWTTPFFTEVSQKRHHRLVEVCNQLDRASLSILLNTAEGNGKRRRPLRAKFFDDARGSATECAACLDALVAKNACRPERVDDGKQLLHRLVSILTKLISKFENTPNS